jgi:hypothetical protein
MKDLHVLEQIDQPFTWAYEELLYNLHDFQQINNDLPQQSFYLVNKAEKVIYGHVIFELSEGVAISHKSAPFGGFSFSNKCQNGDQLFFALEVIRRLKERNVSQVRLHQAPSPLVVNLALNESLIFLGFEVIQERIYQMLSLNDNFEELIHPMELRKLKKAQEKAFRFEWATADLKKVLDFVIEQRSLLGYDFSMNWQQLKAYQKAFPKNYFGATVWDGNTMIAATILVRENEKSIYQFAPAHRKTYNRYSPVVFMTKEICAWALKEGYEWLNLGTSYLEADLNQGLFDFKKKLGAKTFVTPSLQKVIN